jgi:hypothetical protein
MPAVVPQPAALQALLTQTLPPLQVAVEAPPAHMPPPSQLVYVVSVEPVHEVAEQDVLELGNAHPMPFVLHAPVAPHGPLPMVHVMLQQMPPSQLPLVHAPFSLQGVVEPLGSLATHTPLEPGFWQYVVLGLSQSLSELHEALHALPPALQARPFAHAVGDPGEQVPMPLHALVVSMPPEQLAEPHGVLFIG